MKTLFIINPQSQAVKTKGSVLAQVSPKASAHVESLSSFGRLEDIAAKASENGIDWVFIEGGDGTAHGVMTAFLKQNPSFKTLPKFTLLPGGNTNQISRNIGLKKSSAAYIETLLSGGPRIEHSAPLLKLDIDGGEPQFGFVFSTGGIPTATEYCTTKVYDSGLGGVSAVALTILRGVAGSQKIRDEMMPPSPIKLGITENNTLTHLETEHLTSIVTTLPGLLLGLDPFWGKGSGPLRTTFARSDAKHLLRHVLSLWAGQKSKDRSKDGFESFAADTLDYSYDGPAVLDGEPVVLPKGRVTLRATSPVRFIA